MTTRTHNSKSRLLRSALALLICISLLIGSTFAWFTDSVTSKGNIIQSGNLDIEMYWTDDLSSGNWYNVEEDAHNTIFSYDKWEPGYTDVKYIKLVNKGNLAMNYKLTLTPQGSVGKLAEVINVFFADHAVDLQTREDLSKLGAIGLLNNVLNGGATANGTLLAKDQYSPLHPSGEVIMTLAMNMITTAGNEYQEEDSGEFTITALATQASFEKDSFGSDYDSNAEYPTIITGGTVTTQVNAVDGKVPAGGVTMTGNGISAFVPGGTEMAAGVDELTLSVTPMSRTTSDITVVNNEILIPVDVHISGIAAGNTTPIVIDLGEVLPKYMNMGNYHLYHVENGGNSTMTLVDSEAELTEHNRFTYDPLTGAVKVAMASFSEVAFVADTTKAWEGGYDYSWYNTTDTEFAIANADQFAAFGKIVGGMAEGIDMDAFTGKTVKLLSNINMGDKEGAGNNTFVYYPVGYYNYVNNDKNDNVHVADRVNDQTDYNGVYSNVSRFSGTFDGNGHIISNIYQNTWEMFGDYNDGYAPNSNYYKDAMGLFGYVNGGTVKNLTVDSFSSDGEFTPTGVIAAYAVNSTFENIAITNCNPRVYNTGNGGIVGIGGNSDDPDAYKLTFNNITIDNTNKISALWGSWDVACGGLVGMFRGAGHAYMTNCHVAAQIDVFNDVCGNYQYYWYRYSGMLVGTNKNMTTDTNGYTVPETEKFHAENCTVHFGEWNNYYYCELVANSLASYTHDHQFSRLTEISSLAEIKSGDTWTKAGNFLLISGDTKTCYHIVNKDGTLTQHNHAEAGEETVGGEPVLKEDKQIVYLPFNQLFTGYGWGVKHIPLGDFNGVNKLDDHEGTSVKKFNANVEYGFQLEQKTDYTIGELFSKIENAEVGIYQPNVQVTVSPVYGSNVSCKYVADKNDWTQGRLTFTGSGAAIVTITDYYFCTPTTILVEVIEENLFPNGDIEDANAAPWVGTIEKYPDQIKIDEDGGFNGSQCLVIPAGQTLQSNFNYLRGMELSLEPNTTYVFSYLVKGPGAVIISTYVGNNAHIVDISFTCTAKGPFNSDYWRLMQVEFTTGPNPVINSPNNSVRIRMDDAVGEDTYIDNIAIRKRTNLILNENFDDHIATGVWNGKYLSNGVGQITTLDDENNVLEIQGSEARTGYYYFQNLEFKANTSYMISFKAKGAPIDIVINRGTEWVRQTFINSSDGWTSHTFEFTSPSSDNLVDDAFISFCRYYAATRTGDPTCIDDIMLYEVPAATE